MATLFDLPFDDDTLTASARQAPDATRRDAPGTARTPRAQTNAPSASHAVEREERRVQTVSELTAHIRGLLESEFPEVWVEGELSNCRKWNTGHVYFTLKDSDAQIKGVMWRSSVRYLKFTPEDGQRVVARGRLSLYEPKGEYQLVCEHLEPKGLGALQLAYEQLKKRLQAEGLFDSERKRPLPTLPRKIGIVTSLDGAAIRDMVQVLGRRHSRVHLVVAPARVQGEGAAPDIARALAAVSALDGVDVVIVGRGGGSIEDLWAFNEEVMARAIAACPVPVVSAVGHEIDYTIADFVADLRAPTPSAAAELVLAGEDEFLTRIDRLRERLEASVDRRLQMMARRVHLASTRTAFAGFPARVAMKQRDVAEASLALTTAIERGLATRARQVERLRRDLDAFDAGRRLAGISARLAVIDGHLGAAVTRQLHRADSRFRATAARLDSLSPLAVLGRGYAVCWNAERTAVVRRATDVAAGDRVRVTLAEGELECDVREAGGPPPFPAPPRL